MIEFILLRLWDVIITQFAQTPPNKYIDIPSTWLVKSGKCHALYG